ncbi:MAG: ATP synthase F1 subunit delta [Thermoguttaceae bacterium]|nr:ATP synthase F1 subunit delta [Thermoguttaceae bacterium]MBR5757188.1 ATP synthase F1 subunit delta [Thermoguttaceae bacterium]
MKKNIEQDAQFAAKLYADATREKLAEVYAKALFGAADALNVPTNDVWEEYDSFVELCDAYPKFEIILSSVMVSVEEKHRILDEICDGVSVVFTNFLHTLARRGRMDMLREIRAACRLMDDERRGRVPVKITTAAPLNETTKNNLAVNLRKLVGGEPKFSVEVDPEMIGGIIVRVGDVVYDASIATQLRKVRQDMIDRSAHEIQSRRDCFRYPEGN